MLSRKASLGGAVFVGFLSAGPVVSGYYLWKNRGDVAEQYATQLLINEKDLEEDWVGGIVITRLICTRMFIERAVPKGSRTNH